MNPLNAKAEVFKATSVDMAEDDGGGVSICGSGSETRCHGADISRR